jgi:hypothetical protein
MWFAVVGRKQSEKQIPSTVQSAAKLFNLIARTPPNRPRHRLLFEAKLQMPSIYAKEFYIAKLYVTHCEQRFAITLAEWF